MTTRTSQVRKRATARGFAVGLAIITIAVLFLAAIVILQFATHSATDAGSVQFKQAAFDAAEAGVNDGMRALDVSGGTTPTGTTGTGTLSKTSATYTWTMVVNDLGKAGSTSGGISVPANSAYISATASLPGNRKEVDGAIVQRATGLPIPGGAIDAANNIFDGGHAPVNKAPDNTPADVHANGVITVGGNQGAVQGTTYAAGSINNWTNAYANHANYAPVVFPTSQADAALAATALGLAESGTTVSGSNPTGTYTGNVYINGPVNLSQGTIQFNGGGTVYINGNVTISGHGSMINENGSLIVVNGTWASSGLSQPTGGGGQLMVLASDPNTQTCASGGGGCAVTITGNSDVNVGLIFAPYGSVQMAGNGAITGAVVAGVDVVFSGGGSNGAFNYDDGAGTQPVKALNYKIMSFIEK
jgi:hypothetical protein